MIEPEIAFADLFENMDIAEAYVKFVLKYAMDRYPEEMIFLEDFEKSTLAERKKEAKALAKKKTDGGEQGKKKQVKQVKSWQDTPLRERLTKIVKSEFARVTYTDVLTFSFFFPPTLSPSVRSRLNFTGH